MLHLERKVVQTWLILLKGHWVELCCATPTMDAHLTSDVQLAGQSNQRDMLTEEHNLICVGSWH